MPDPLGDGNQAWKTISHTSKELYQPLIFFSTSNNTPSQPSDNEKKKKGQKSNKKPLEPPEEPTTCCMSGCANCVWLEYAEKMTEYYKDGGEQSIKEINERIQDPMIKAYLLFEIRMRNNKK